MKHVWIVRIANEPRYLDINSSKKKAMKVAKKLTPDTPTEKMDGTFIPFLNDNGVCSVLVNRRLVS